MAMSPLFQSALKRILYACSIGLLLSSLSTGVGAKIPDSLQEEIRQFGTAVKGKEYFLRCTILRVSARGRFSAGKATDPTNVFPDGNVYYQGTIEGGVQINTQDPGEFTEEARRKLLAAENNRAAVVSLDRGSLIVIHDFEVEDDEIRVQITLPGSYYSEVKSTVRFKMFDDVDSLEHFERMFYVAFAQEEYEVKRGNASKVIDGGMGTEELTKLLGHPDYIVNLSQKTVLVYGNLRYVFNDNKLVDLE